MECHNKLRENQDKLDALQIFENRSGNLNNFDRFNIRFSINGVTIDAESNKNAAVAADKSSPHNAPIVSNEVGSSPNAQLQYQILPGCQSEKIG